MPLITPVLGSKSRYISVSSMPSWSTYQILSQPGINVRNRERERGGERERILHKWQSHGLSCLLHVSCLIWYVADHMHSVNGSFAMQCDITLSLTSPSYNLTIHLVCSFLCKCMHVVGRGQPQVLYSGMPSAWFETGSPLTLSSLIRSLLPPIWDYKCMQSCAPF